MTKRLSRLLRVLHPDMAGHAEWAQAHGPLRFSFHPKHHKKLPFMARGTHGGQHELEEEAYLNSGCGLQVQDAQSRIPRACHLLVGAAPGSTESSLRGQEHSQGRPGRGALKQGSPVQSRNLCQSKTFLFPLHKEV